MKIIVIGGNPAGLSAASRIRKSHSDWQIDVYEKFQFISYGSCGIPYYVADDVKSLDNLITLTKEKLEEKRKIPIHLYHEVTSVDFGKKEVIIKNTQDKSEFTKSYDYLVIATGGKSSVRKLSSESIIKHPRIFKVHTLAQADRLKSFLNSTKCNSAVIIGSGYIGLEMLEAYSAYNIQNITLIGPRLNFRSKSQEFIREELEQHNINLIIGDRVDRIESLSDTKLRVITKNGIKIESDLVQLSIGVDPATDMFQNTDLEMSPQGAIIIDEFCRTNIPNVYAAGDCATSYNHLLKKNVYLPLAPIANKQGRVAGNSIAGIPAKPNAGHVATSIFKVFNLYCAQTGLTDEQALKLGFDVGSVLIKNNEIAHYYPNVKKMSVLLRFDKKSHLLLGAELTAPSSLGAKKIDVLATALKAKMTIEDIQDLDLAYAPPFSPVWDPILIAANIAEKKLL